MTGPLVIKLGGELIETPASRSAFAAMVLSLQQSRPLVVVHGGGRAIDAELARRGITPKKRDGIRITDAATLEAVVAVLAGTANTDLVAALVNLGIRAVGLTGVDAGMGQATIEHPDLGLVGDPAEVDPSLVELLMTQGYVPVVASLGIERGAAGAGILNINADVMACRLAAALGAELIIAGTTAGVLDNSGTLLPTLTLTDIAALINDGTATTGMVAKLRACQVALEEGVPDVRLVDGRAFGAGIDPAQLPGSTLTREAAREIVKV
ncbi:MAG: acetylglutamate kinase [Acidobacteria bacterium]|jgi:acetylglutamate kinase|nr:acetylglutamate kinase [Acidobacteriota bacterium]